MGIEEFREFTKTSNPNYPMDRVIVSELPTPDSIYYKDFHFLDEPLINRKPQQNPGQMTLSNQKDESN